MTLNMTGLTTFASGIEAAIDEGVNDTAVQIHDTARALVSVDTGALRTSIEVFGAGGSGERTVEAGQSLAYAAFVEYGTSRQAAQRFMTPAAEQHGADLEANIERRLRELAARSQV